MLSIFTAAKTTVKFNDRKTKPVENENSQEKSTIRAWLPFSF